MKKALVMSSSRKARQVAAVAGWLLLGAPLVGCLGDRPSLVESDGGGQGGTRAGTGGARDGGSDARDSGAGTGGILIGSGGTGAGGIGAGTGGIASGSGGAGAGGRGTGGGVVPGTGGQGVGGANIGVGGAGTGGAGTGGVPMQTVALSLSFAGAGAGTVVIQPGGNTCTAPTGCTAMFAAGTNVTLTAKPTNGGAAVSSVLSGWTGACAANGPYRVCTLTLSANTSTAARFDTLPANLVFTTSASYAGNLGGAAAYQTACNTLATAAGINNATGNAYIAWLAASNYAPVTLLGASRGWVRADLLPWIDILSTALSAGNVYYPVAYDENGQRVIATTLAGMTQTGAYNSGYNCADWTDATSNSSHGSTHAGGTSWAYNNVGISSCSYPARVICVMKGSSTPIAVAVAPGKKIYLTRTGWVPGGGLASADAKCMSDRPASVISARAILVSSTRALGDVLIPTTTYVRPDGVKVGTGADIAQAMNAQPPATIEAPLTQDGAGTYVNTGTAQFAWTGLSYTAMTDKDTCRDWTSAASTDSGTIGGIADGWEAAGKDGSFGCNNGFNGVAIAFLECAEQ